jgi:hypothetical protein
MFHMKLIERITWNRFCILDDWHMDGSVDRSKQSRKAEPWYEGRNEFHFFHMQIFTFRSPARPTMKHGLKNVTHFNTDNF